MRVQVMREKQKKQPVTIEQLDWRKIGRECNTFCDVGKHEELK